MNRWLPKWVPHKTACRQERQRKTGRARHYRPQLVELESRVLPSIANVAVTTNPAVQQMPSIAADPLNSQHLVVAYMDYSLLTTGYAGIGTQESNDGGATWSEESSLALPSGYNEGAAQPIVQFDDQGRVFVTFMSVTFLGPKATPLTNGEFEDRGIAGSTSNNGIFESRSDDGGMTWDPAVAIVSHLYDGKDPVDFEVLPQLVIDDFKRLPNGQKNPNFENQYLVWTRVYGPGLFPNDPTSTGGTDIMFAVSKDGGHDWMTQYQTVPGLTDPVTVINDPNNSVAMGGGSGNPLGVGYVDQSHVTVGPEGDIYVAWFNGGDNAVAHSTDAGATFGPPDYHSSNNLAFGTGFNKYVNESGIGNGDQFRTFSVSEIAADPSRPGTVYVVAVTEVNDKNSNEIDPGDILFARSTDYGVHWTSTFNIGTTITGATVLNDDNGGQSATNPSTDVVDAQAQPRLAVDNQGNISVIWYDTRRDPAGHDLDVFGTTSTDGGLTFAPNYRVTTQSFDPNLGAFTNPTDQPGREIVAVDFNTYPALVDVGGQKNYYIGDFPGLAMANGYIYAAWTDTRNNTPTSTGNQDVYFARYPVTPAPAALNDRFEPNDTPATATDFGKIVQRLVPSLALPVGDEDWFSVVAAATGPLTLTASSTRNVPLPSGTLELQLWDETGTTILAAGSNVQDASGNILGQNVVYSANSGQAYLIRLFRNHSGNSDTIFYGLDLQSLTADLGTQVVADKNGTVAAGGQALYKLTTAAAGSIEVQFTQGPNVNGNLDLQILDPTTFAPLFDPPPPSTISAPEPNDSIPQAIPTGLVGPGSVQVGGSIGDGLYGDTSGDYDFYSLVAASGQRIVASLKPTTNTLDGVIVLYNSAGKQLLLVDNTGPGAGEFLSYDVTQRDTYYIVICGYGGFGSNEDPPANPFLPGQGHGVGKTGPYSLTITLKDVGPGAEQHAGGSVEPGQTMLLLVSGEGNSTGDFNLQIVNLDQFTTPDNNNLVFPAGAGPSQMAVGDLNGDGKEDVVVTNAQSNTVSVLINNGDGTFQAPRQYAVGSMVAPSTVGNTYAINNFRRPVVLADLTNNGKLDIVVGNYDSGDVSVLLNRGDGTFEPQRRFNATSGPFGLAVGDVNGDSIPDIVAIDSQEAVDSTVAVLLGRGDGTFRPAGTFAAGIGGADPFSAVKLVDLNGDGKLDLIISGSNAYQLEVLLGNGDGTFQAATVYKAARLGASIAVADINGDGKLDIAVQSFNPGGVEYLLGNGDGTFTPYIDPANNLSILQVGVGPLAIAVADLGSQLIGPAGAAALGPHDGHPDLIYADSGVDAIIVQQQRPGIYVVPTLWNSDGEFTGLGTPELLATGLEPLDLALGDFSGNNPAGTDIAFVDEDGVHIVFGNKPTIVPNDTPQSARNLGTVVHVIEPTLTIVPGHEDAYYTLAAPSEAAQGAGDEVLDFSGDFQAPSGAGIGMEVLDAAGNVLGSGDRFRVRVPQGAKLTLHVFGLENFGNLQRGAGAYTLDIVALPQVVSIQSQPLLPGAGALPGGPTASLVVTLQGERLDPTSAQNPANYTVTWLGPDGVLGTADDQVIPSSAISSVVYDPSTNIDVSNGFTYPTAVRQTVTLVFDQALPAGSYEVDLSLAIQTAAFNNDELSLLTPIPDFMGHPVVSTEGTTVSEGSHSIAVDLVFAAGELGSFDTWETGTPFFTQLHDDLGALLDQELTQFGDAASISATIDNEIVDRFDPALGPSSERPTGVLVLWFDTLGFSVTNPRGLGASYNLTTNTVSNDFRNSSINVLDNIETAAFPVNNRGSFQISVRDVPAGSQAGGVFFGLTDRVYPLTDLIRAGQQDIPLNLNAVPVGPPNAASNPPEVNPKQEAVLQPPVSTGAAPLLNAVESDPTATTPSTPATAPAGNTAAPFVNDRPGPPPPPDPDWILIDAIVRRMIDALFGGYGAPADIPPGPMDPPDLPEEVPIGGDGWPDSMAAGEIMSDWQGRHTLAVPQSPEGAYEWRGWESTSAVSAADATDGREIKPKEWPRGLDLLTVAGRLATDVTGSRKRAQLDNANEVP